MCDSSVLPWAKTAFKHVCQHFLGAFLVPYVLFLLTCGIPMFLVETAMGQFTSQGCITCWRYFCPLFEGQCVACLIQTETLRHNSHSPPTPTLHKWNKFLQVLVLIVYCNCLILIGHWIVFFSYMILKMWCYIIFCTCHQDALCRANC